MRPATRVQATYDIQQASDEATYIPNKEEIPVTRQEFTADCDINKILQRGGVPVFTRQPQYGEIDYNTDLAEALHTVRLADTLFMELPADLREEYKDRNTLVHNLTKGRITIRLKEWLEQNESKATDTTKELLTWLQKNHTEPESSTATPPTTKQTPPSPGSARAAG